ncbi:hypothetical protein E4T39_05711 [Aureobasidium subglaciale]|nr:hypothetical protein E4T39_05711 [Aureobasidium subglaciale]
MHFLASAAVPLFYSSTALAASCSTFTQSGQPYTQPSVRTQIISKGVVCDVETTARGCPVPYGGWVTDERTLNITVADPDSIFERISDTVNFTFNRTVTEWIGSQDAANPDTAYIKNGTAIYEGYTSAHRCVSGTLSGCDDSELEDTAFEACTPYSNTGNPVSGIIAPITSDRSVVAALTCNPANTTEAKNGNNSNSCTGTEDQTGVGVADGLRGGSLVLLIAAMSVAVIGL